MMGRRPHDEVSSVLSRAALLVNTSEVEGFPNAYLEAWNHGVPVVTFNDVDGIIAANRIGVVVASLEQMVNTVRTLEPAAARSAMGDAGRRYVAERFSPERLGAQYVDFFTLLEA
jgi:glycosyltransferase involved in cell wall biosynthesis